MQRLLIEIDLFFVIIQKLVGIVCLGLTSLQGIVIIGRAPPLRIDVFGFTHFSLERILRADFKLRSLDGIIGIMRHLILPTIGNTALLKATSMRRFPIRSLGFLGQFRARFDSCLGV